jgi:hypothetical protein
MRSSTPTLMKKSKNISIFDKYKHEKQKNIKKNCMGAFLTKAMLNACNMSAGSGGTR